MLGIKQGQEPISILTQMCPFVIRIITENQKAADEHGAACGTRVLCW